MPGRARPGCPQRAGAELAAKGASSLNGLARRAEGQPTQHGQGDPGRAWVHSFFWKPHTHHLCVCICICIYMHMHLSTLVRSHGQILPHSYFRLEKPHKFGLIFKTGRPRRGATIAVGMMRHAMALLFAGLAMNSSAAAVRVGFGV